MTTVTGALSHLEVQAVDWITRNLMAIRRDNGDMEYLLRQVVRAYLAGHEAALEASLPEAPTDAMLIAARDWSVDTYGKAIGNEAAIGCWQAMLRAATEPPAEGRTDAY